MGNAGLFKYDAMQRKSIDKGFNKSPLNRGEVAQGVDGIRVRLIGYPDEAMLRRCFAKMVTATTGADIDGDADPSISDELFQGGLQTGLKAFTLIFEISGVSRALTHELVRTSLGVYHQQSMRHTDMGDRFDVREPTTIVQSAAVPDLSGAPNLQVLLGEDEDLSMDTVYRKAISVAREAYAVLKRADIPYQDARFVCPIGTQTYVVATYPIKVFLDTFAYRACNLMMWEIAWLFREMRRVVIEEFPWMASHIRISCEKSHRCTFQGWEATSDQCDGGGSGDGTPYPWAGNRTFKSDRFGG